MLLATDLEAVIVGLLMQHSPDSARRHLDRLEPTDFTDWRAAEVVKLLAKLVNAGHASIDPAAVFGYAQRIGAIDGQHKLKRIAEWMADAYGVTPLPLTTLDFHVDLLIEASYRRHVTIYAKRLQQAEQGGALDLLDEQITAGYARLAAHRQRFTTTPAIVHTVPEVAA